jgi:hypothetical protein
MSTTTNNAKQKHAELLRFTVKSCIRADELDISLNPHLDDAYEFLHPTKAFMDVYKQITSDYLPYYEQKHPNFEHREILKNVTEFNNFARNQFATNLHYQVVHQNFIEKYNKFTNENRNEEFSLVKKIVSLYKMKEITATAELDFLSGFLERYVEEGIKCGWMTEV